jgi:hypothetical protein
LTFLMLSSYLCLGLLSGLFSSGFPTKILYTFIISPCMLHAHLSHPRFLHPNNIWRRVQIMEVLIMQCCSASCYLYLHMFSWTLVLKHLYIHTRQQVRV